MNLHFKLFIPVLLLLVAMASTMHFYWPPNYLALDIKGQQKTEHAYADLLGIALIPDLINNDLAKIHATLDHVLENREYWYAINLYAQDNQIIYPLASPKLPEGIKLAILKHKIMFDGYTIAQFEVWIDINAASALRIEHIYHLEELLLLTLLAAALLSTMLQDRGIRFPLKMMQMSPLYSSTYWSKKDFQEILHLPSSSARKLLQKNHYSLLLLDLMLPDANGLGLIRELRKSEDTRKLPIIVISGRANEGRKEFNATLTKSLTRTDEHG